MAGLRASVLSHQYLANCTQCHAPSAALDQCLSVESVPMLPPLDVVPQNKSADEVDAAAKAAPPQNDIDEES